MIDQYELSCLQTLNARADDAPTFKPGADCRRKLDISFFFDGMGRSLDQDILHNRTSNIGRMFLAHLWTRDDSLSNSYRKHYYSGLGTPFETSLSENLTGATHRVPNEAEATRDGRLRNSAIESAGDVASGDRKGRWWEVFGHSFKGSITRPWNWVKQARDSAVRTGAEAFAPIRDNPIAANLLVSGSHTRQSSAIRDFQQSVQDVQQQGQLPLAQVRVSVFGFDFGAALAKAFVRELLDETCAQEGDAYHYRGIEVQVVFIGLLDCVDRTHPKMGPLDWFHPLTPVLDDGGALHPGCRRALHLIAAHERRFYRRCRPLGTRNGNWHEELCPGISEDIGGGLASDEQKTSAELSRATLHRMYRRATIAGVPFPSLESLAVRGRQFSRLFELNDQVEGYSLLALARHYQRQTGDCQRPTPDNFRFHTLIYLAWLAQRFRDYREALEALEVREDALPNRYYNRTLGVITTSLTADREQWELEEAERADIDAALDELKQTWGWLEEVDGEAQDIRRRFDSTHHDTRVHARAMLRDHFRLAESWHRWTREEAPPPLPEPIELLFAHGLHDKQPEEMAYRNRQTNQLTGGYRFMAWRGIDVPETTAQAIESSKPHPREGLERWTMR